MNTRNFGLLIADDNPKTRENYQEYLTEHPTLRDIWVYDEQDKSKRNVLQAGDAYSALQAIKKFIEETSYHMIVLTDAYMPPNSDGNKPIDKEKLFGGLKLIDEINKNKKLKERVTVILITFYDDDKLIKNYRNRRRQELFNWKENIDYYFVSKIFSRDDGLENEEDSHKKLLEVDNDLREKIFAKTLGIILKITDKYIKAAQSPVLTSQLNSIVGRSKIIQDLKDRIKHVAPSNRSVLLLGETGTGKDAFAKAIYFLSNRNKNDFFKVNCATIPQGDTADSLLFGHTKDIFSDVGEQTGYFEAHNKGTIFLNEIGELPKYTQAKFLEVIDEGTFIKRGKNETTNVDVRIIAATNQDVSDKSIFRSDLKRRFDEVITIPPLRERKDDIPKLAEHFLQEYNKEYSTSVELSDEVMEILKNLRWPANVGQLEKTIGTLVYHVQKGRVEKEGLEAYVPEIFKDENSTNISPQIGDEVSLEEIKKAHIISVLKRNDWNAEKASKILGEGAGSSKLGTFKNHCMIFILERNDWNIEKASEILGKGCRKKHLNRLKQEYHPEFNSIKEHDDSKLGLEEIKAKFTEEMFQY